MEKHESTLIAECEVPTEQTTTNNTALPKILSDILEMKVKNMKVRN